GGAAGGLPGSGGAIASGGAAGAATALTIPGAGHCAPPAGAKLADAQAAYTKWMADLVTSDGAGGFLRVKRPNSSGAEVNSTVSEGIGYAMLLAVYANDQTSFDKFWKYANLWLDGNGLMNWYINAAGTQVLGTGAASDGDEDMAFALVMADKRWGGQGSLSTTYLAAAKKLIDAMWQHEVDHSRNNVLMPGDQFADGSVINISYFAPAYYRVFARVSGNTGWNQTVETTYTVLAATLNAQNGNASNGLVPAWSTPAGVPMAPAGTSNPTNHQLDSCRTPFRIGQDYCWNAEPRALSYLQKVGGFYSGVTVAAMVDGYDLNGTPHAQFVTAGGPRAASFVGGAGVAAMATGSTYAQLRDDAYTSLATLTDLAGSVYYQESWTALSLQMMTGLLRDLTM
ncbi:MAG TPA: glycosyl hydrolase family 8, partial [Polyangia bacterium]|nr:glycosyl hydrolase family 8 [Polyangia bacterium]